MEVITLDIIVSQHAMVSDRGILHKLLHNQYLIIQKIDSIMRTQEEILQEIADIKEDVSIAADAVGKIAQQIADLQDKIGKGLDPDAVGGALDGLKSNADAVANSLKLLATPPASQPPADQPPADQPPADQPPVDQPPVSGGSDGTAPGGQPSE